MPRKIRCILLIDDDPDDNFLHELIIRESDLCEHVRTAENGIKGLQYLKNSEAPGYIRPDVILLDINMPGMNGFEFLQQYEQLPENNRAQVVLIMLTTSLNPDDEVRARGYEAVQGYRNKPLTKQMLEAIASDYFARN